MREGSCVGGYLQGVRRDVYVVEELQGDCGEATARESSTGAAHREAQHRGSVTHP